ncbi:hypothetical protein B1813_00335 [Saccharomonospora piscinae]|uniref:Cytochrome C biogenesis protein transmembrane region n=1 Tax=Saccharomonospora piscinae TaxID=687388 RepID=A0A1V9ABV4_SACPI|nr:hypothetical protein [Saccharomonospora piscinae]OQO94602.1 hypothetical protein B1813_00335 [Saccharomonospora piscinae]
MSRLDEQPSPAADLATEYPRRRWRLVLFSSLAGFLLTVVWSASFVDSVIGGTVADTMLGQDAEEMALGGIGAGIAFALVSGIAGTFTACNIAVFSTMAPLVGGSGGRWQRARLLLRPLLWLGLGMVLVSAVYGAVVGFVGTGMPQFDDAPSVPGELSGRLVQASVVFGIIGLVLVYLGLAAVGVVRDPFARRPNGRLLFLGALVGAFLIGRPFPLFRQLFRDAAEAGDPLYGAGAFVLQSLGNVVLMAVLLVLVSLFAGPRVGRWLAARQGRLASLTAAGMLAAGVFLVLYWNVRLLAMRDILPWYPLAPWV